MNKVTVTLADRKITSTNIYLFVFMNGTTNKYYNCVVTDLTPTIGRYNTFCISCVTGSTVPDPTKGEVNLPQTGFFEYTIYENPTSATDPTGLWPVEIGKMKLIPFDSFVPPAYISDVNPVNNVYTPQF